ncbi:peptidylprolyl isomerase, partial [Candidatus Sumerlaeota bacterium]|nr:peptidylprolyl isomerase [Candidatus Sumerlaeota bacterium]
FSILFFLFAGIVNSEVEPTPTPKQDMELAKFDGKILKMDEFIEGLSFRSGYRFKEMGEERIANMDPKELENLAQDYLFSEKMAEIAEKEGFADDPKVKDQMESIKQRILANLIYKKEVMDKVPEASEDECKQYYEDNKKEKYGRPFSFKMRHIFLSTYLPYVAVKGDTLEGIAEKICKDKGKVEYILKDDETKDPRYVKPEEREEKPFRALEPGEKILVPMSDADKMAVYEKTKAIHEDLKKGADFSLLAKKHSETGANKGDVIGPIMPDKDQKPMLPEIIAAVKKTEAGKFSEIVQTKHGYNIIKVEEKNDEGFIPYDQIQRTIQSTLTGERRLQESKKFLLKIAENAKGIIVNKGAFDAADHSPDSVIVEIGDKVKFTLADYDEFVPEPVRKKAETSDDKIVAILESRKVILPLLTLYAENQKLDQSEEFKSEFRHRKIMILSDQYLRKLKEDLPPPTEEEMREYYDKNLDRYKDPQKYDLSVIGRKIKDYGQKMPEEEENKLVVKLTQELNEIRKKIKTREEFEKMAREISEDPTSRNGGAIGFVPLSYRNGFGGKLEKMKAGDISEPFVYINFVYLLMVNDMIPEKIRPFEEAKNSVERDYSAMKHQEFDKNKREEILKAGGFEFLKK